MMWPGSSLPQHCLICSICDCKDVRWFCRLDHLLILVWCLETIKILHHHIKSVYQNQQHCVMEQLFNTVTSIYILSLFLRITFWKSLSWNNINHCCKHLCIFFNPTLLPSLPSPYTPPRMIFKIGKKNNKFDVIFHQIYKHQYIPITTSKIIY